MSSPPVAYDAPLRPNKADGLLPVAPELVILIASLLCLYALTLAELLGDTDAALWTKGEHSHGPLILTIGSWLLANRWRENAHLAKPSRSGTRWAWLLFALGGCIYVAGRSLGIIYFAAGSLIPMLIGVVLLMGGFPLLNRLKFPLFFMVFMVPLPGFLLDPISHFIKLRISIAVTQVLWSMGYPVAHTGVIIHMGQYELLVADACAGMRSLFMLEAMGLLYLNTARHSSWLRNLVLGLFIVPISFTANMIRVITLALITYYFGDEAGQGFLHGFAGVFLFISALLLTIALDALLRVVVDKRGKERNAHGMA